MNTQKYTCLFFLLPVLYSCSQKTSKHEIDPAAIEFNDSAMTLMQFINNNDSCEKAILLLDNATAIDNDYATGYYNKITFLIKLDKYDKAIIAINHIVRIKPNAHDIYLIGGIFYEKIKDTLSAEKYFTRSLSICNNVLDTMSVKNQDYLLIACNNAINLLMLGDQEKANKVLKDLYENNPELDNIAKEHILSLMDKTKSQLLKEYFNR